VNKKDRNKKKVEVLANIRAVQLLPAEMRKHLLERGYKPDVIVCITFEKFINNS